MNIADTILDELLSELATGDGDTDARLRKAFHLGAEYAAEHPDKDKLIKGRAKTASRIVRTFGCTPEAALIAMDVPRKERKPVLKILQVQARQKNNTK